MRHRTRPRDMRGCFSGNIAVMATRKTRSLTLPRFAGSASGSESRGLNAAGRNL